MIHACSLIYSATFIPVFNAPVKQAGVLASKASPQKNILFWIGYEMIALKFYNTPGLGYE